MPTYDFKCVQSCGHEWEEIVSWNKSHFMRCPNCCTGNGVKRQISLPAPPVFKGPGFHVNDYPKKGGGE